MRNSLELESKRVKDGALWSEEYAPVETIFWGAVMADHINGQDGATALMQFCNAFGRERVAQFGGKATVGKGLARMAIARAVSPAHAPAAVRQGVGEHVVYPQ